MRAPSCSHEEGGGTGQQASKQARLQHLPSSVSRGSRGGKGKGTAFMADCLRLLVLGGLSAAASAAPPSPPFGSAEAVCGVWCVWDVK